MNVYALNWENADFFKQLFSKFPDMSSYFLILGGDFNCWLKPELDRSFPKITSSSKSARTIKAFMKEFSISDPWCFFNPTSKMYSSFSHVHHTFTRVDYFLVDNRILPSASSSSYGATVISDHSPISLSIQFGGSFQPRTPWRLNVRLLSDEKFVDMISNQIDLFLSINKTPEISASVLWDTLKAYIRGQIISFANHEKKQKQEKSFELTNRIAQLDSLYATSPTPDVYKERLSLQSQFNTLTADHAAELILKSRSNCYEQGGKAAFPSPDFFFAESTPLSQNSYGVKKIPRIRKQFLQRPKALGGMALPNLRFYYRAAHLRITQSWLQSDSHHSMPVCLK